MNPPDTLAELVAVALQGERHSMIDLYGGRNNCIGATAIAVDVCSCLGVAARPIAVQAVIESPGYVLTIGFSGARLSADERDIHVICSIDDGALLDLSLDQACEFEGFSASSLFLEACDVSRDFWKPGGTTCSRLGSGRIVYRNHENDRSYEMSEHWSDRRMRHPIVDRIIVALAPLRDLYSASP